MTPYARIGSNHYGSLTSAYSAASSDNVIQAQAMTFTESLTLFRNFSFIFRGGYDSGFSTRTGYTTVQGKVTLSGSGRVVVDKLKIR